ncbi:MAG: SMI1/KNR4 family protein [Pirellula sp.]|nr:SMI1/KNR4 family protein [Pirellula sp.]
MRVTLDEAFAELRRRNEPVLKPPRLPTEDEVNVAEGKLGVPFHSDYRRFLLEASDISFSVLEPATITIPGAHTDLFRIAQRARGTWKVPVELVPICEDNADIYCMTPDGRVIFWSHDMQAPSGAEWPNLAAWIEDVWMFDYEAG